MEVIMGVVADAANMAEGGKLNILGIFHHIFVQQLPAAHPHLALAMEFRASPYDKGKNFTNTILLLDPDGKEMCKLDGTLTIARDDPQLTPVIPVALNFQNLNFPLEGNYRFEVQINGRREYDVPLEVRVMPRPFVPGPPEPPGPGFSSPPNG